MAPRDGRPASRWTGLALAILLLAPSLAGCAFEPTSQLSARRGDLARLELVVAGENGTAIPPEAGPADELCGAPIEALEGRGCPPALAPYVLLDDRPAHLPEDYANATPLPGGLVEAVEGLAEGGERTREDVLAWGPRREGLVREHERRDRLPRVVDGPQAYGRTWNGTRLDNGSFEIQPRSEEVGARIEAPAWCNERFCLFGSRLANWTSENLLVEHRAREGDAVHVRSLDTFLTVVEAGEDAFTVDGNDPRAGERFDVYVRVDDLRGPPQAERRAPPFNLTTLGGGRVALADLLGKPVVIEFFATWCPSCAENADHLARLADRFGDRVNLVSIDVDPWESTRALRSFTREHNVTWPVAIDERGEASEAYGVGTLSTEVLVGPEGAIRHVETGVADHDRMVSLVSSLLEERRSDA